MNKGLNIFSVSAQDFGEVVKWIGCLSKALMFYILHSNKQQRVTPSPPTHTHNMYSVHTTTYLAATMLM